MTLSFTVRELAEKVGAEFTGDGEVIIESAAPIEAAAEGQISFLSNPAYKKYLKTTNASALVVAPGMEIERCGTIVGKNPYLLFSQIIDILYPPVYEPCWEIDPTARISDTALLPEKIQIGPNVVIEDDVTVGNQTIIRAGSFIGKGSLLGKNCQVAPNVSIMYDTRIKNNVIIHSGTVIGADGFGFAPVAPGGEYKKVRQVGWVEIGDNVEIGANVTIDRGAIGPTVIERGVKIDNLVMIAHNVRIGENSIIVAQVGISGSTKIGKSNILAGQVGVVGHIETGDYTIVGAQSGVSRSLTGGTPERPEIYFGSPTKPIMQSKRIEAAMRHLPEIMKRISRLERAIEIDKEGDK